MVYIITTTMDDYKQMGVIDGINFQEYNCLLWPGDIKGPTWRKLPVEWIEDSLSRDDDKIGDFMHLFPDVLVINERAYQVLKDVIANDVEFLPVDHQNDDQPWYIVNVTNVIDIMDESRSKRMILDDEESDIFEEAYIDFEEAEKHLIFKVKNFPPLIFINEALEKILEDAGLTGFNLFIYENPSDFPAPANTH